MAINSNKKGKAGERELANYQTARGFPSRRGQQYRGGNESPDVICDRIEAAGFLEECKRVEALNIHKAIDKCAEDCDGSILSPVVMHRKNGTQWLATLRLDDFLELIDKIDGEQCGDQY